MKILLLIILLSLVNHVFASDYNYVASEHELKFKDDKSTQNSEIMKLTVNRYSPDPC